MSDGPVKVDQQKVIGDQAAPTNTDDQEQQRAVTDFSKESGTTDLTMRVRVRSPFRDYYDGFAFSLTAESATGPFDILPKHHNFISLLVPCELILRTVKEGERKIRISGGVLHVKADQIIVFLDV